MQYRYGKTPAGHQEIQARRLNLARPVRNLLLIIGPAHSGEHWLAQVKGCTEADLRHLISEGLIARAEAPAPPRAVAGQEGDFAALQARVRQSSYAPLYDALNAFSKDMLGLVKGYRFTLEVERCSGPAELQALALRFLDEVRAEHGPAALRRFADRLPPPAA